MRLLTYAEAKASRDLAQVTGVCGSGEQFRAYLNQAVEALMRRGNFFGTVQKMHTCVRNNCIVHRRGVGTILATRVCGRSVPSKDFWSEFLPVGHNEWTNWGLPTDFRGGRCMGDAVFENAGTTSVFANVPCNQNFYVRAYVSTKADVGKKITIFGTDGDGQTIRTDQGGVLLEGVVLTLNNPFTTTPMTVRWIDRVIKERTQGVVRLYFFDTANNTLWDCAEYQPNETSPSYLFSRLTGWRQNRTVCPLTSIDALVKMDFEPVENDNDLVGISNVRAIKHMIKAIRAEDAAEDAGAKSAELDAFRELNYELRDKFPIEQFVSSFNPFGTARFERVSGGMI